MNSIEVYKEKMPLFCEEVLKQVCVPKTHPKYTDYINDAIWKYQFADNLLDGLGAFFDFNGKKVLDIGAGSGGISAAFAKKGALVTALDVDAGFERLSKLGYEENNVEITSVLFDGFNYPFKDKSFDIICWFNIYEHVPDVNNLFVSMKRLLKKDGIIIGRADYKWNLQNIKSDPHYGIPINILLPRCLRELSVIKIFKRSNVVEDYKWAPSYKALKSKAKRFGFESTRYLIGLTDDNIIFREKNANAFEFGSGKLDLDNYYCFEGFYNTETWGDDKIRWSGEKSKINLFNMKGISSVTFEVLSFKSKSLSILIDENKQDFNIDLTNIGVWNTIVLEMNREHEFEVNINLITTTNNADGDSRNLGVAIKNIVLGAI